MKYLSSFSNLATLTISLISVQSATAATLTLDFTKLSGLTGGSPGQTAVFRAEIPALNDITSMVINDNSQGQGGSEGQVSGFDLDAIKLSSIFTNNAADVNSIAGLDVFDFSSNGTVLTLGTQRPPEASQLFGNIGGVINNLVATLENFDANSTTDPKKIFGFVTLGDDGKIAFKLKSPLSITTPLYLYFGEVGDNGEVATVEVMGKHIPEPSSVAALSLVGIFLGVTRSKKNKAE
ncbi:PEP-CTERM sorting domain-containing protein [Nostoc sp. FACHB-152]|uniref:PEP-CTERM sorting domain-containing protein n=1 Tax=unclassified Nostoc TaxID=2593658 RepID=UPI00168A2353|nr:MULTISPECIES: PEP-CTERM sorting domain-containing protein [unclassified Nostoc]MBD2446476.1 PEP-CTERM sorting domain-containing protein [Nostoc sp. FACHB-152]MBD2469568.1 PEP-CTERM sorting domain-containing protein [Nostoc sp. FACHB-145]